MPVQVPQYPVNLIVSGRRCLVVGGGRIAQRKIEGLLVAGASVHVIAVEVSRAIQDLPVTFDERAYRADDVVGYRLVIAATGVAQVERQVFEDGERHGVWVNAADDPANCSFTLPAVVRRGPLTVAIGTGGHSPALATWLKAHVAHEMGPEYEALLALLSEERDRVRSGGGSTEDLDWQAVLRPPSPLLDLVRRGRADEAREELRRLLVPLPAKPGVP